MTNQTKAYAELHRAADAFDRATVTFNKAGDAFNQANQKRNKAAAAMRAALDACERIDLAITHKERTK